jgi:hypothetical protein
MSTEFSPLQRAEDAAPNDPAEFIFDPPLPVRRGRTRPFPQKPFQRRRRRANAAAAKAAAAANAADAAAAAARRTSGPSTR